MLRTLATALLVLSVTGCGEEPPCVDEEGEELPVCTVPGVAEDGGDLLFCPGDQWGAEDGCNSCGCDDDGNIFCTSITC